MWSRGRAKSCLPAICALVFIVGLPQWDRRDSRRAEHQNGRISRKVKSTRHRSSQNNKQNLLLLFMTIAAEGILVI
jgi:hypothetical protein